MNAAMDWLGRLFGSGSKGASFPRTCNVCGYQGLQMTQLAELGGPSTVEDAADALEPHLLRALGFM